MELTSTSVVAIQAQSRTLHHRETTVPTRTNKFVTPHFSLFSPYWTRTVDAFPCAAKYILWGTWKHYAKAGLGCMSTRHPSIPSQVPDALEELLKHVALMQECYTQTQS